MATNAAIGPTSGIAGGAGSGLGTLTSWEEEIAVRQRDSKACPRGGF